MDDQPNNVRKLAQIFNQRSTRRPPDPAPSPRSLELTATHIQTSSARTQNTNRYSTNRDWRREYNDLHQEHEDLQALHKITQSKYQRENLALQQELNEARKRNSDLQLLIDEERKRSRQEVDELKVEVEEANEVCEEAKDQLKRLKRSTMRETEELREKLMEIEEERNILRKRLGSSDDSKVKVITKDRDFYRLFSYRLREALLEKIEYNDDKIDPNNNNYVNQKNQKHSDDDDDDELRKCSEELYKTQTRFLDHKEKYNRLLEVLGECFDEMSPTSAKKMSLFEVLHPPLVGSSSKEIVIKDLSSKIGSKYDILRLVGEGDGIGQGSFVFLVRAKISSFVYAMKVISIRDAPQDVIKQAEIERSFLAMASHQFITKYFDSNNDGDYIYTIMEFCPGGDLQNFLEEKSLTESQVKILSAEIFLGLEYTHSKGFIWRDLKPSNILFDRDGHIRLSDFGLAKEYSTTSLKMNRQQMRKTKTFSFLGSEHYPQKLSKERAII
eukprot:TRINITY_DN512_c0_g1_i2.p1 TRINITY_DN512_c0_g1~~TRINITY_DN512_c0_g1_i2.p1  ORF type:complete len:499 (-),score=109.31 TRINITY_DN512_c0_g1_i2:635-2131(-)